MDEIPSGETQSMNWWAKLWRKPGKWFLLGIPVGGYLLFVFGVLFWTGFNMVMDHSIAPVLGRFAPTAMFQKNFSQKCAARFAPACMKFHTLYWERLIRGKNLRRDDCTWRSGSGQT